MVLFPVQSLVTRATLKHVPKYIKFF